MPSPPTRDPLGLHPIYYREDGHGSGPTLVSLLRREPALSLVPDRDAIGRYLRGEPDDRRTCVEGVAQVPAGHRLVREGGVYSTEPGRPLPAPTGTLDEALIAAVASTLEPARPVALALSGGLDSALVLAIVRRALGRPIPVFTLAIDIPGYGELEATRRAARHLEVELHEIPVSAVDLVEGLPAAVRAVEVPMWNPHPVTKLLLARALRREGFAAVLTGDAADQVFSGAPRRSYLPLVGCLFRRAGVEPCSPFFDPRVLAQARGRPIDPHKRALRELAARWLPDAITRAPKGRRLAPDLGVERLVGTAAIHAQVARLGLPPPRLEHDRDRCGYTTLCLLWRALEQA